MKAADCFSGSYAECRDQFRTLAGACGAELTAWPNRNVSGASGEALTTDVARIGPANAGSLLILSSGTHGVEGYCGSGVQANLLARDHFRDLPGDMAVLMIHAINPFGFSHDRRVNEDNIDINRNFRDFSQPLPDNPAYGSIHALLVPEDWDGPARRAADERIRAFISEHGLFAWQTAVSTGQHDHADGLFYGGRGPAWSNDTLRDIVAREGAGARCTAWIDFHTGLGPYGHGEIICIGTPASIDRTASWHEGGVTSPAQGTSSSADVGGTIGHAVSEMLPDSENSFVALEFGTQPVRDVLGALRADNWLHLNEDCPPELRAQIKRQVRDAFYGDADDWKEMIWARSRTVIDETIAGLAAL